MGEAVGHGVAVRRRLQAIVADRPGRRHGLLDVAGVEQLPFLIGVGRPDAGQAIGHQFDPDRDRVGLGAARVLLRRVGLGENAEQVLDMVADLVGDHVGVGEIAAAAVFRLHVAEERQVEIDLLVERAIERPHRRLGAAAAGLGRAVVEHQRRRLVAHAGLRRQRVRPHRLGLAQDMADEQLQLVVDAGRGGLALRRRRAHVGDDFRAADQHARIDAGEVADDGEDQDRPEPEAARAAEPAKAAAAAPILDVVG